MAENTRWTSYGRRIFSRRDDQLTLSGFSAKASALIELLERSDLLTDVRFRSPVNLDPRIQLERFNLSAAVVAEAKPQ